MVSVSCGLAAEIPRGLELYGPFVQALQDITACECVRGALPGEDLKSGTTTLDNGFQEVLSFPETLTMAQRNGFEMEEP